MLRARLRREESENARACAKKWAESEEISAENRNLSQAWTHLAPGLRVIDGKTYYSSAWLGDRS